MTWWLLQNALGAAILAGAAAALSCVARLSPPARHALWLVVLAKLLAPPLLLWPNPWEAPVSPGVALAAQADAVAVPATGIPTLTLLAGVWLCGGLTMALVQAIRIAALYRCLRGGRAVPAWLLKEAERVAVEMSASVPRLVVVPSIATPLLAGGLRPRLAIPADLLDRLCRTSWRSVLIHELAHVKRRDHWVSWLELVASCVWWWNPVFWHARRRLRENAEYACDAWVVRLQPEGRRGYAESLITVVDAQTWKPASVAIGMAAGGKRIFKRRLEMILREAVPHRMSTPATLVALLIALAVLPSLASPKALAVEAMHSAPVVAHEESANVTSAPVIAAVDLVPTPAEVVPARSVATVAPSVEATAPVAKARSIRSARPGKPQAAKARPVEKVKQAPEPVEPIEAAEVEPVQPTEKLSPLAFELQPVPQRLTLGDVKDTDEEMTFGPKKIEVHGEVRIRAQQYSGSAGKISRNVPRSSVQSRTRLSMDVNLTDRLSARIGLPAHIEE